MTLVVCIYDFGRKRKIFLKTLCAGFCASAKVAYRSLGRGEFEGVGLFSFFGDLANNDKRLCFVPLFSVFPKISAQGASAKVACAPLTEGSPRESDFFLFG